MLQPRDLVISLITADTGIFSEVFMECGASNSKMAHRRIPNRLWCSCRRYITPFATLDLYLVDETFQLLQF